LQRGAAIRVHRCDKKNRKANQFNAVLRAEGRFANGAEARRTVLDDCNSWKRLRRRNHLLTELVALAALSTICR
jgi:hypothetical protein